MGVGRTAMGAQTISGLRISQQVVKLGKYLTLGRLGTKHVPPGQQCDCEQIAHDC